MKFAKMHGLGNDFVLINCLEEKISGIDLSFWAEKLCHRHFGIGADGLMLILPSEVADLRMRIFNADGSEAEMCGNGIRCFAKFAYEHGLVKEKEIKVETLAGIIVPRLHLKGKEVEAVEVDMGMPRFLRKEIPMLGEGETKVIDEKFEVDDKELRITCVSMGNPHCVIFVDDVDSFRLWAIGASIENHLLFPQRSNVEFVQVMNPNELKVRVWERGVGETLACGTGACASLVASVLNNKTQRNVKVRLRGGNLSVEWRDDNHIFITGPAQEIFNGEMKI